MRVAAPPPSDQSATALHRYGLVAIILHWVTAAMILTNLGLAWRFDELEGAERGELIRLHKSIGLSVLFLTIVRIGWRFVNKPPPLPKGSLAAQGLARSVHVAFYVLLLAMPLSGWAMISTAANGRPTKLWGVINWPRILPLAQLRQPQLDQAHEVLQAAHLSLGALTAALILLHVVGALRHHLAGSQGAGLWRMTPQLGPRRPRPAR